MMSEISNTKRKVRNYQFGDLPPRVIVYDILSLYLFEIDSEYIHQFLLLEDKHDEFVLFGRFTRDRARNKWMIFTSIQFEYSYILSESGFFGYLIHLLVPVDVKKLFFLGIKINRSQDFIIGDFFKESEKMVSMRILEVDCVNFSRSILEKMKFPHLKSLEIHSKNFRLTSFGGSSSNILLLKLEKLKIKNRKFGTRFDIFQKVERGLLNLRILYIRRLISTFPVRIILPKLEKCDLSYVENITLLPGTELRILRLEEVRGLSREDLGVNIIKTSKKLENFELVFDSLEGEINYPLKFILDSSTNQLSNLKTFGYLNFDQSCKHSQKDVDSFLKLKNQLVFLNFIQHSFEYDVLSGQEFQSLERLDVRFHPPVESNSDHIWPISLRIKTLELTCSGHCDQLFQKNEWPCLEYLSLAETTAEITGKGWNRLPNLCDIEVEDSERLLDSLFQEKNIFSNLRCLILIRCNSLKGEGWDEEIYKNLESLEIKECTAFTDKFFKDNEFLSLKNLDLCLGVEASTRIHVNINWKAMRALEYYNGKKILR